MKRNRRSALLLWSLCGSVFTSSIVGTSLLAYNSSLNFRKDDVIKKLSPRTNDKQYDIICADYDSNIIDLSACEDDQNMLYPYLFNYRAGEISLNLQFLLNPETYYMYFNFNDEPGLRNLASAQSCLEFEAEIPLTNGGKSIQRASIPYETRSFSTFCSSASDNPNVRMTTISSYSGVKFTLPSVSNAVKGAKWKITKFRIVWNQMHSYGNIVNSVMRKGSNLIFIGFPNYAHELCGIKTNWTSGLKSGTHIRLDIPYGKHSITNEEILNSIKAVDLADGATCDVSIRSNAYTGHQTELDKKLQIVVTSEDRYKNASLLYFDVYIHDKEAPVINFNDSIEKTAGIRLPYDKPFTEQDILEHFKINDNYDLVKMHSASVSGYDFAQGKRTTLGDYPIKITATDVSSNKTTLDSTIHFYDDVGPVISGPDSINIAAGTQLSEEKILEKYTSTDEIDGTGLSLALENNTYVKNYQTIGTYSVDVVSSDKSGNRSNKTILMNVSDSEGPVFYVDTDSINSFGTAVIQPEEAVKSLVHQKVLPDKLYNHAEFIGGNYPARSKRVDPGTYSAVLRAYSEDGETEDVNLTINVKAEEKKESKSGIRRLIDYVRTFFSRIFHWFTAGKTK